MFNMSYIAYFAPIVKKTRRLSPGKTNGKEVVPQREKAPVFGPDERFFSAKGLRRRAFCGMNGKVKKAMSFCAADKERIVRQWTPSEVPIPTDVMLQK